MSGLKAVGLISAAGLSSRMGAFKPFLNLDGTPLLCRTVESLLDGGVQEIVVVTGRNGDAVTQMLSRYPQVKTIYNEYYAETAMYDSIKLGLQQIQDCDVLLFLPADVPAIRPETVQVLLKHWMQKKPDVLFPVYQEKQWHPPVISGNLLSKLLEYPGEAGLKGALETICETHEQLLVPDKGCTMDADYTEEYQEICRYWKQRDIPDAIICETLYELAETPEPVQLHCKAVAEKAMELANIVEKQGVTLNRELLYGAALLHDVCRTEKNHAEAGAVFLRQYGFYRLADLIAVHMDWPEDKVLELNEATILYLADKLVSGNQAVSLEQRFAEKIEKYMEQTEIAEKIRQRLKTAIAIQQMITTADTGNET